MSAGRDPAAGTGSGGSLAGTLAGVLGGVLTFLVIVLGLLWFGDGVAGPEERRRPQPPSPVPSTPGSPATPTPATPTGPPSPQDTPSDAPSPTAGPPTEETERDPEDADAAAFTTAFEPPGARDIESVTVDVTGDGWPEVVVVSLAGQAVRLDVAAWTGTGYEVTFTDGGGQAEEIERFIVRDLTGDGAREIATVQTAGGEHESLSLWGWDGEQFARQVARGGCWHGEHVYGIAGVALRDREIAATCDGAPEPSTNWSTDVYVWDDGAWRHDRTDAP